MNKPILISLSELPEDLYSRIYDDQRRDFPFGDETEECARVCQLTRLEDGAYSITCEDDDRNGYVCVERGEAAFEWCHNFRRSPQEAANDEKRYRLCEIGRCAAKALGDSAAFDGALERIRELTEG